MATRERMPFDPWELTVVERALEQFAKDAPENGFTPTAVEQIERLAARVKDAWPTPRAT